jgi:hypothetical protein
VRWRAAGFARGAGQRAALDWRYRSTVWAWHLPLAIGMVASQLRHHPAWTAAELTADLAAARDRLALMRAENVSVGAAFDLSYQDLTAGQQRLFRRLGLIPGPDFDAYASAALDGTSLGRARRDLDELYDQHFARGTCTRPPPLHDLLREHARAPSPPPTPPNQPRRPGGCSTTTCTPPWPPEAFS